ncbi:29933_t:CDS:2, partial [Gigaspora margarita]
GKIWEEERLRKQVHIYHQISSSGTGYSSSKIVYSNSETVYSGITNNRTNNYIGEPSISKSLRSIKHVNYAEIDDLDEERESRKIRRTNNTTNLESAEFPVPRTPLQVSQIFTSLMTTPNKRPINISVICAFNKSVDKLTLEISMELANELSSVHDTNPEIWTPDLEKIY